MTILLNSSITFADAISDEGIDYGTGYYLTHEYSDGTMDYYGPYNFEEDAILNQPNIID